VTSSDRRASRADAELARLDAEPLDALADAQRELLRFVGEDDADVLAADDALATVRAAVEHLRDA